MGEFLIAIVAAFLIFMVLLPVAGILAGIFFRVGLPYAAGYYVSFILVWIFSGGVFHWGSVLALSAVWTGIVWMARRKYQERKGVTFSWHEGHYRAAYYCFMLLAPQRKSSQVGIEQDLEECQAEA